jgi:hypothetical protein
LAENMPAASIKILSFNPIGWNLKIMNSEQTKYQTLQNKIHFSGTFGTTFDE